MSGIFSADDISLYFCVFRITRKNKITAVSNFANARTPLGLLKQTNCTTNKVAVTELNGTSHGARSPVQSVIAE